MREIKGVPGAPGKAIGEVVVQRNELPAPKPTKVPDPDREVIEMESARLRYIKRLKKLEAETRRDGGQKEADILEAYVQIAGDAVFFGDVAQEVLATGINALYIIEEKRAATEEAFSIIEDEYLRQRAEDINNVCRELSLEIMGREYNALLDGGPQRDFIVFAEDLTPAETMRLDRTYLRGFVTEQGGVTSHSVILAKSLGIPAVVGAGRMLDRVENGMKALLDGDTGRVVLVPDATLRADFSKRILEEKEQERLYVDCLKRPGCTRDGRELKVCINTGDMESAAAFDAEACDGIGLFRTEFLYLSREDYPDEEVQYNAYRQVVERAGGKEVIIRTLDIGADKQAGYMNLPREENPALGERGIRLCLDRKEMFKIQLCAILRAAVHGQVKVMFPMIVSVEELLEARKCIAEVEWVLEQRGAHFKRAISVGVMIETPAAALIPDRLARHCDFFSIGTNDLTQYIVAADRMNARVQYLHDSFNISVLRAVNAVARAGKKLGVPVAICGEAASDIRLIPLWVGMGITELSVAPALVGRTKFAVSCVDEREMAKELPGILDAESIDNAREKLEEIHRVLGLV